MKTAVHVLGVGAIGGLVAHELTLAHPQKAHVTLMFKAMNRLKSYKNREMKVNRIGPDNQVSTTVSPVVGGTVDLLHQEKATKIHNLIVATKTYQTATALAPYMDLIDKNTNILFVQNGMGVIDECVTKFWQLLPERPNIYKAVVTHGAYKTAPDTINHVGMGTMTISHIPQRLIGLKPEQWKYPDMVQMITATPNLAARTVAYDSFVLTEIEKLAVNACINPLTALLDCANGDLFRGAKTPNIMKKVINELLSVVRAEYGPVLSRIPEANTVLEPRRLLSVVFDVINVTKHNSSSMREDVRNLNKTEIDYINGFIVSLGRKHGISTPSNRMLTSMIKTKLSLEKSLDRQAGDLLLEI